MLNCGNEREIISCDGNYRSDFYRHAGILPRARKVICFTYPSRTFLPSPKRFTCASGLTPRIIAPVTYKNLHKRANGKSVILYIIKDFPTSQSEDCNLKSFDFDCTRVNKVQRAFTDFASHLIHSRAEVLKSKKRQVRSRESESRILNDWKQDSISASWTVIMCRYSATFNHTWWV
jgi:hypothetical protein